MDEYRRLLAQMDSVQETEGFDALVTAAFFQAVQRRFATDEGPVGDAEVVKFIVAARKRTRNAAEIVPPDVGELLINLALGKVPEGAKKDVDDNVSFRAKVFLLQVLVGDEGFSDAELESFLSEAREAAEEAFT